MRRLPAALLVLMLLTVLQHQTLADPPEVPKEPLKLKVGEDTIVEVKLAKDKRGGFAEGFRPADCLFFQGYSKSDAVMRFLVRPKKAGFYRVAFWTVGEDTASYLEFDAETPFPVPPGPPPGPPPNPPPQPPPIPPQSELGKEFQRLYDDDSTTVGKAEVLADLVEVWKTGQTNKPWDDEALKTNTDFVKRMRGVSDLMITRDGKPWPEALKALRTRIATEVVNALGKVDGKTLDRPAARDMVNKVLNALQEVRP